MVMRLIGIAITVLCVASLSALSQEQSPQSERESAEDAMWTGPMLAPSAATLPRGHFLAEPYVYFIRRSGSELRTVGSLTYLNYGVTDKLTVGMIPTFGYNVSSTRSSSGPGLGDVTVQAQHRLTTFKEGSWVPAMSIALLQSLPTGKYDRLGGRGADGFGTGAYITSLAFYSQRLFWLRNGRILRMRFNVTHSFPESADIHDQSVYGTPNRFRGTAKLGQSNLFNAAWEYSVTRNWVVALDATYSHASSTIVNGRKYSAGDSSQSTDFVRDSGSNDAFALAPAIEYNWNHKVGVLLGIRFIPRSHNTTASITPAVAINMVR